MIATVYTDGSVNTGGPGGIGFVASVDGPELVRAIEFEGSLPLANATNQQAEILAAAYALDQLDPCSLVVVWSDSEYVVKGMTSWIAKWMTRGWKTGEGKPVKNQAHWQRLIVACGRHEQVAFQWLKGHAGHPLNERADQLAGEARRARIAEVEAEAA